MEKNQYQRLADELDSIILAEINERFGGKERKKQSLWKIFEIIEEKNREVVKIHQNRKTASILPTLFKGCLQMKAHGELCFEREELNKRDFELYSGKKGRFEVLVNASLNSMEDEHSRNIVYQKREIFAQKYDKAKKISEMIRKADEIRQLADKPDVKMPENEEAAISYLKNIGLLRTELQKLESRYMEFRDDDFIAEPLQQLQNAINLSGKSVAAQSRNASEFVFNQVSDIFRISKVTRTHIANIEEFMAQKEGLVRYYTLFDSIGDESRKDQISFFISNIEKTITSLQKEIEKEKARESAMLEENNRKINAAYETFLLIKKMYADGDVETKRGRKKALSRLKKCQNVLKSNGQRVKAREIDRFLNATDIHEKYREADDIPNQPHLFYKKAFLAILPLTIILAILSAYHIFSAYRTEEVGKSAIVTTITKKENSSAKYYGNEKTDE